MDGTESKFISIVTMVMYAVLTPAVCLWSLRKLIRHIRAKEQNILQEQRYAMYALYCT